MLYGIQLQIKQKNKLLSCEYLFNLSKLVNSRNLTWTNQHNLVH